MTRDETPMALNTLQISVKSNILGSAAAPEPIQSFHLITLFWQKIEGEIAVKMEFLIASIPFMLWNVAYAVETVWQDTIVSFHKNLSYKEISGRVFGQENYKGII